MSTDLPYPRLDEDQQLRMDEERAAIARDRLDPSDVLAVTQHIMLEIADDTEHPLWPLVQHCTRIGTTRETGKAPHIAEQVGAAFLPLIDRAISRLVTEALSNASAWED